jgi:hypothetical protein
MVSVLSIDIGIHNLSMCIISTDNVKDFKTYKIELLDVYDILEDTDKKCQSLQKNNKICNKKCSMKHKTVLDNLDTPRSKESTAPRSKESTAQQNKMEQNCSTWVYTCKMHNPKEIKSIEHKRKTIDKYLLQDLVTIMITKINYLYKEHRDLFVKLTKIHLELQPSTNTKMKLMSHVIYTKLIDLYLNEDFEPPEIKFIPAKQKLKVHYTGPELICKLKTEYAKRKWMSIQIGTWYFETQFSEEKKDLWLPKIQEGKSDDKADVLLMDINALYGIPKTITSTTKKFYKRRNYRRKI